MMHSLQHRPSPSLHSSHHQQFGREPPTTYFGGWGPALSAVPPGPSRRISGRASANIVPYSLSTKSPRTKRQRMSTQSHLSPKSPRVKGRRMVSESHPTNSISQRPPAISRQSSPLPLPSSPIPEPNLDDATFLYHAERALDTARASKSSLEIEERLIRSFLREEELAMKQLHQDMEAIRERWQVASHEVGLIRASIMARGFTPKAASPPPIDDHALAHEELESALQNAGFEGDEENAGLSSQPVRLVQLPSIASLSMPSHVAPLVPLSNMAPLRDGSSDSGSSSTSSSASAAP